MRTISLRFASLRFASLGAGWFFFVIFCGVGLAALPIDLVCAYMYRPRHMDAIEFAEAQLSVRNRVGELIEIGELLKREREDRKVSEASETKMRATTNPLLAG